MRFATIELIDIIIIIHKMLSTSRSECSHEFNLHSSSVLAWIEFIIDRESSVSFFYFIYCSACYRFDSFCIAILWVRDKRRITICLCKERIPCSCGFFFFKRKTNSALLFSHIEEIEVLSIKENQFIFFSLCEDNMSLQTSKYCRKNYDNFPLYCKIILSYISITNSLSIIESSC